MTRGQCEQEHGQKLSQADPPEVEGRAVLRVDLPADRHLEHLEADHHPEQTEPPEAEIALPERGPETAHAGGGFGITAPSLAMVERVIAEPLLTDRLSLAPWSAGGVQLLARLAAQAEVMRFIGPGTPWPPERSAEVSTRCDDHRSEERRGGKRKRPRRS